MQNKEQFLDKLNEFYKVMKISSKEELSTWEGTIKCVLVIDGSSLKFAL